jgi:hypothetical protein
MNGAIEDATVAHATNPKYTWATFLKHATKKDEQNALFGELS